MSDLPPLPPKADFRPEVCAIVHLYLAVWDDLSPEQQEAVSAHVRACVACAREQWHYHKTTMLVADLPASAPSAHIDVAVRAAIAARNHKHTLVPLRRRGRPWLVAVATIAALFILAFSLSAPFLFGGIPQAFALPENLSWSSYVLYSKQTITSSHGEPYSVVLYCDLATGRINVKTAMDGKLDVVLVGDEHETLGKDMMHNVAQWGADDWGADTSMFNLAELRKDMQAGRAQYQGKDRFQGQDVYRIRRDGGLVLLLDMDYMPVNVLENASDPGTGKPMYEQLKWLQPSQVPTSMWDMSVPPNFKMGRLPEKP